MSGDPLDIAVRAYAVASDAEPPKGPAERRPSGDWFPEHALIFDTETTTDSTQRLLFGAWQYCRREIDPDGTVRLVCVQEGLFYADDLPEFDPDGFAALKHHAKSAAANVAADIADASTRLRFEPLSAWLKRVLWRVAYKMRGAVVCFNAPFDLSRIAWHAGYTRQSRRRTADLPKRKDRDAFEGGFSFALWSYTRDGQQRESRHRPRLAIKSLDSKRSLKGFRSPDLVDEVDRIPEGQSEPKEGWRFRGHFLDLRTLVFALTDRGHSLESASRAFGVPYEKRDVEHGKITDEYVTYCREDVTATTRLAEASLTEFRRHPIDLQAVRAYSPATLGKAYLREMGITPPRLRQGFGDKVHGWAMSAYYGGRAECRIRRTSVPVVYCDFKSMYPTVCALMNLWSLLTAETITATTATEDVQALLDTITADDCFDRSRWPQFVGIAKVRPDGDILPVRARYGPSPSWQIGVNYVTSDDPLWYSIPDLIASKLLTGKAPRIEHAITFDASEPQAGLMPTQLLGSTPVDPAQQDFFTTVIEQRTLARQAGDDARQKGLKTLANATSYGIYAQMTRREPGPKQPITVYGRHPEPLDRETTTPEDPGEYAFPPIATAITGAARLLLALVEHEVVTRGGTYAFCDTDSMTIVATEHGDQIACPGGPERLADGTEAIRSLTWQQVDEIRDRFTALNPYDPKIAPGSILELEGENRDEDGNRRQLWCFAISAKRYTFHTP